MGLQPHWFGTPRPPHVAGATQDPQFRVSAHWSETRPQVAPRSVQVLGAQGGEPHSLGPLPPQICPAGQEPQSMVLPQPSGTMPQPAPGSPQRSGVQPQMLAFPRPPQVAGAVHAHSMTFPQASGIPPQESPADAQVMGGHTALPQRLGPPPPQVIPAGQGPQDSVSPHPSRGEPTVGFQIGAGLRPACTDTAGVTQRRTSAPTGGKCRRQEQGGEYQSRVASHVIPPARTEGDAKANRPFHPAYDGCLPNAAMPCPVTVMGWSTPPVRGSPRLTPSPSRCPARTRSGCHTP
jgi:hypothetical protein